MIPAVDSSHVTEGPDLLTSHYKGKPVITGMVTACMLRFQEIENAFWSLLNGVQLANHPMAGGPWSILDQIGVIVDLPRAGWPDASYKGLLLLKARVNRSRGLAEDMIQIAAVLAANSVQVNPPVYVEYYPAAFYIGAWDVDPSFPAAAFLSQARAAGTYGMFAYTTWPNYNDFEWCDVNNVSTTGQGTWADSTIGDPLVGGLLVSGVGI